MCAHSQNTTALGFGVNVVEALSNFVCLILWYLVNQVKTLVFTRYFGKRISSVQVQLQEVFTRSQVFFSEY